MIYNIYTILDLRYVLSTASLHFAYSRKWEIPGFKKTTLGTFYTRNQDQENSRIEQSYWWRDKVWSKGLHISNWDQNILKWRIVFVAIFWGQIFLVLLAQHNILYKFWNQTTSLGLRCTLIKYKNFEAFSLAKHFCFLLLCSPFYPRSFCVGHFKSIYLLLNFSFTSGCMVWRLHWFFGSFWQWK
jgi:hypothetical protein